MDNELLSIGDMARITGASVQALRYYDREGIVRPAYVSGRTGYRYYSPSQTINVDAALACVELGIPLKEARSMLEGEVFGTRRLFERGVKVARERALAAEAALRRDPSEILDQIVLHHLRISSPCRLAFSNRHFSKRPPPAACPLQRHCSIRAESLLGADIFPQNSADWKLLLTAPLPAAIVVTKRSY